MTFLASKTWNDIYDHLPLLQRPVLAVLPVIITGTWSGSGTGASCQGKGSAPLLQAFYQLPHSPSIWPLCVLSWAVPVGSLHRHVSCLREQKPGCRNPKEFIFVAYIHTLYAVRWQWCLCFSSLLQKGKIQWSYKCVHFEQLPLCTVYITQLREI